MILINSSPKDALKIFQPFLPIFVPVGLGYIYASAVREGIRTYIADEQIEEDMPALIAGYVKELRPPYIFAFSVLTAAFKNAVKLSEQLKKLYPDSMICFGGVHPTAAPEEVMSFPHIDFVLRGEGEYSLVELYRRIKNREDFTGIKGLTYRKDGRIFHNEASSVIMDLDGIPPFPYHIFASKRYDLGFVVSSRGCPYSCIFCSNRVTTGRKYRFRDAGAIVDEIEMLYRKYKKDRILFLDDNLLVSRERIYTILEEIKRRGLHKDVTFSFQARGDNVNYRLLKDLYDSGFRSVFFGLETASEEIMKTIKKGETVAQCAEAVRLAKEVGFHVSATFIYALPGETHEDRMNCIALGKELRIDMLRFNNATPYPGTELYAMAKKENRLNNKGLYENFISVSTFIESPFRKIPFSYVPAGNSEEQIRRDILLSYYISYLDIRKLKTVFTRTAKGVAWFNPGERLPDLIKKLPALGLLAMMLVLKFGQLICYLFFKRETALSFKSVIGIIRGKNKAEDSKIKDNSVRDKN